MENGLIYRYGTINDKAALRDLGLLSYGQYANDLAEEHWQVMKNSIRDEEKLAELIGSSTVFVCENGAQIIGVAYLVPSGNPTQIFDAKWSYIRMLGVHPEHRGMGIGKALTKMCVEKAKASGETTVALHTSEFQNAARHIYEGMGFRVMREIGPMYGKKYWIYTLDINGGKDFAFEENICLENERARLEPLAHRHLEELKQIIEHDNGLMKYSTTTVASEAGLREYINSALEGRENGTRYAFAIFDKVANKYAGSTSFVAAVNKDQRLEIGFTWIGYDFQRTGLNAAIKYLMLEYVFEILRFKRVELKADSRNQQSRRAMERIGATYEGELRSHMVLPDGYRRHTVYYSILADEWPQVKRERFSK